MYWFFSLQKSISKWIFAGYTGSKNPVRNRLKKRFVELDFSKLIFQKSSTDQQGEYSRLWERNWYIIKQKVFPSVIKYVLRTVLSVKSTVFLDNIQFRSKWVTDLKVHAEKLYISSTINNDFISWQLQLIDLNTSYLTDSYIGFTLKMESVSKNTIFGLKMMVKSGVEKFIWKSLHAGR